MPEETPTEPTLEPRKKRGWPRGKPRGPRKPKPEPQPEPEKGTEIPIEAPPARYSPDAVEFVQQPVVPALEPVRRRRAKKTGVTIDGRYFPCQTAVLDGHHFMLWDGAIETRVPVDGVKKLEFSGVSLSTGASGRSPRYEEALERGTDWRGRRVVEPMEFVNNDPTREQESKRFSRDRNRELEAAMALPKEIQS